MNELNRQIICSEMGFFLRLRIKKKRGRLGWGDFKKRGEFKRYKIL